jgi:hypothetical protein
MTDPVLSTLKTLDPVDVDELRAAGVPPLPSELLTRAQHPLEPNRRRRVVLRLVAAAAVAGALVLIVGLLPALSGSSPAQRALRSVAATAAAHPAPAPTGFLYTRLRATTLTTSDPAPGYSFLVSEVVEQWTAADGSGRIRSRSGAPVFAGPRDEQRWRAAGSPALAPGTPAGDERLGPRELTATPPGGENLPPTRELPTDVDELLATLDRAAEQSSDVPAEAKIFELAAAVLIQSGASPQLRAALYEVVASLDGVTLNEQTRDPRNRSASAVSLDTDYSGAPTRSTLFFDRDSAEPLAYTSRLLEPQPWVDGRELGTIMMLESDRVDSIEQRP